MKEKRRKYGYYWVRFSKDDNWVVAKWTDWYRDDLWIVFDYSEARFDDSDFHEINEVRIEPPKG